MRIDSSEILTTLFGSQCMEKLFKRIAEDVDIPIISKEYIRNFIAAEQRHIRDTTAAAPATSGRTVGAAMSASSNILKKVYRGEIEGCPFDVLNDYSQALIRAFRSRDRIGWLGIIYNELELDILLSTMKVILVITNLSTVHEHFDEFRVRRFLETRELLEKKVRYNLRLADTLQRHLIAAYFNYWRDSCGKNTIVFLEKCKDIFSAPDDNHRIPYIQFDRSDTPPDRDMASFIDQVQINNRLRGFLPIILRHLSQVRLNLTHEYSSMSRIVGRSQERVILLTSVLERAGLKFEKIPRGSGYSIVAINHTEFINLYRLPQNILSRPRLVRMVSDRYPGPSAPHLCFDIYDTDRESTDALTALQSFLQKGSHILKLKPERRIRPFQTEMLGHDETYHSDREDIITIIQRSQEEYELLACRFLWFKSALFLDYPGFFKSSKHWTMTPEGNTVRISERNSRLNLMLAIKLYSIWLEKDTYTNAAALETSIKDRLDLWFMKGARRTYLGDLGNNIDTIQTSALYQTYSRYLNGRLTKDEMGRYLQTRWRDYIAKINSSLGIRVRTLELSSGE